MWHRAPDSSSPRTTPAGSAPRWVAETSERVAPARTSGLTSPVVGRRPTWTGLGGSQQKEVPMKDLTVSLEDRPGALADLGEALGKAGINIEGMCAVTSEGRAIGHVLIEDATAARTALESAGIKVEGEAEPLIWETPPDAVDRPGAMGESARIVA